MKNFLILFLTNLILIVPLDINDDRSPVDRMQTSQELADNAIQDGVRTTRGR